MSEGAKSLYKFNDLNSLPLQQVREQGCVSIRGRRRATRRRAIAAAFSALVLTFMIKSIKEEGVSDEG